MAKYRLYQNNNEKSTGYGKYYAHKVAGKLLDLDDLAAHMAGHKSPYSKGLIRGILTDLVECVRELAYEGNQVKIEILMGRWATPDGTSSRPCRWLSRRCSYQVVPRQNVRQCAGKDLWRDLGQRKQRESQIGGAGFIIDRMEELIDIADKI